MVALAPLALQVEAAHRLALLLEGTLRYALPAPDVRITRSGQVVLEFSCGDWDRDRHAVELVARARYLPRPRYRREEGLYVTENSEWRVLARKPPEAEPPFGTGTSSGTVR